MTMSKTRLVLAGALLSVFMGQTVAQASLIGETVIVSNTFDGSLFQGPDAVVVVEGGGPELSNYGFEWDIDIEENYILFNPHRGDPTVLLGGVDVYRFEDIDWGSTPVASVDYSIGFTNLAGVSLNVVSDSIIEVIFADEIHPVNSIVKIDINAVHAVPEPSSFILAGLGLGVVGLITRKRRRQAA